MFEPEIPEMPERDALEIVAKLQSLKRVAAPADFADRLQQRIAKDRTESPELQLVSAPASVTLRRTPLFPYQRTVYSIAAAALITVVLLNMPSTNYPPPVVNPNDSGPAYHYKQPGLPSEQTMEIKPAPGSVVEKTPAGKSEASREHVASADVATSKKVESNSAKAIVQQPFPQELMRSQRGQSTPLVGGSLSTVSRGSGGVPQQDNSFGTVFGQGMSMQPLGAVPVFGMQPITPSPLALLARDSARIRDSIRNAHKVHRTR